MIVDTMSYEEIISHYSRIHEGVLNSFDINPFKRFLLKHKDLNLIPQYKYTKMKYDNNTEIYVRPKCNSYHDFKKGKCFLIILMIYGTSHGRMVLTKRWSSELNSTVFAFYTSHYFDRYRERFLKDPSIPKQKVILDYFTKDPTGFIKIEDNLEDPSKPSDGMYLFSDGLALMDVLSHDKIYIYKTFLPLDDLSRNKQDTTNFLGEVLEEGKQYIEKAMNGNLEALHNLWAIADTSFIAKYGITRQKKG